MARALGELARERWEQATGQTLEPPPPVPPLWPEGLDPSIEDVDVAISRTVPEYADGEGVHEIEALYLAAIRAAQRTLYIESQYFASRKIAQVMAERLREPDGPEIVVINPETADGWLEEEVMGSSRSRLLREIEASDRYDRFRMYTPVTAGRRSTYVHAKVMVVDDWLVKVGSSNFNNRSLGYDTERDLSIEAQSGTPDAERLTKMIGGIRTDLLAEHLGVTNAIIEEEVARDGSLIGAIERLRSESRSLVPFEPPEFSQVELSLLAESQLLDPERPSSRWRRIRRKLNRLSGTGLQS